MSLIRTSAARFASAARNRPRFDLGTPGRLPTTQCSAALRSGMEQLAAFLTSPAVAPGTPPPTGDPQVAMAHMEDSSPEAAGIFRLFHPLADPVPTVAAEAATDDAEAVPLPPRRPRTAALTGREALTLAASNR